MKTAGAAPWRIVVTGVSGSGKSTVGRALAARLGTAFLEGDEFHTPEAVAKMHQGHPLTDADRWPWLDRIGAALSRDARTGAVAACSALKRVYRARLVEAAQHPLVFVMLSAPRAELDARVNDRPGHFMPASLLKSQLALYEPLGRDERGTAIETSGAPEATVEAIVDWLQR
jgi:gluconokinase